MTDFIWHFFNEYPYVSLLGTACIIVANWGIFKHHFDEIKSHEYFMDNIEVIGRFCGPSYDMWKTISLTVIPIGVIVIAFTILTGARTKPFMAVFGTRGASKFKRHLIRKALRFKEKQT